MDPFDPTQIIARLEGDNPPSDAELETAAASIREALDEVTKGDEPDLDMGETLHEALKALATESTKREEAREERRQKAKALREGIFDDEPEAKADDADDSDAEPSDEPAEPEAVKEPVAASGGGFQDLLARLKSQTAARTKTTQEARTVPGINFRALGPAGSFNVGEGTYADLGKMFATHAKSISGIGKSDRLFNLTKEYPENRVLGLNTDFNNRQISEVFGFGEISRPVTAAGGLCGPGDVDHSHPICADRGRPVRDALVQFNASRGQVTYSPAAGLGDVAGAVSVWTNEMDAAPTGVKPCPDVTCPDELNAKVDAITACLTIGNFQAKFSPELWASRLELLMALHDRIAEQKAIEEIHEASAGVTPIATANNVIASFLQNINSIIASDRAIQRKLTGTYVVLADMWVRDQLRNQVIENLGVQNNVETLQIADSMINGWLSDIGARAVWTPDGTVSEATGEHNIPAAVGALPATTTVYVYPEDAYFFLDGGTLDLGTQIVDSVLNATNDRQAFSETFEKVAFRGCSSYFFELSTALVCGC